MLKNQKWLFVCLTLIIATIACYLPFAEQDGNHLNQEQNVGILNGRSESRPFGDAQVEVTVPGSYIVGYSGSDLAPLVDELGAELGPEAAILQQLFRNQQDNILFWGYESVGSGLPPVSFVVMKNDEFAALPLGIVATFADTLLGADVNVIQQDRLTLGGRDTLRLVTMSPSAGPDFYQVAYIFKESGSLFVVGFVVSQSGVAGQLPIFNSIVSSLKVV